MLDFICFRGRVINHLGDCEWIFHTKIATIYLLKNYVLCSSSGKGLQGGEKAPFQELEEWIGFVQKKLFMLILCPTVYVRDNNQIHKLRLSFEDKKYIQIWN